jgi:hypothetical protein
MIDKFVNRLKALNIEVELHGNYPWIYLYSVNGNKVIDKHLANHGFTAFLLTKDTYTCPSRAYLFKTIRKYL